MNGTDALFDVRECAAILGGSGHKDEALRLLDAHDAMAALVEAVDDLTANLFSITKAGIRTPLTTREAATKAHAALANVRGVS